MQINLLFSKVFMGIQNNANAILAKAKIWDKRVNWSHVLHFTARSFQGNILITKNEKVKTQTCTKNTEKDAVKMLFYSSMHLDEILEKILTDKQKYYIIY